jgi:hypothetical protein
VNTSSAPALGIFRGLALFQGDTARVGL